MSKRLTVPPNSKVIILPTELASQLFTLCQALRNPKRNLKERLSTINSTEVASQVLLALIDGDVHV